MSSTPTKQQSQLKKDEITQVFLFDRDSTLLSRSGQIINAEIMVPAIQGIVKSSNLVWGIVSTGSTHSKNINNPNDNFLKALKKNHNVEYENNPPAYPCISSSSNNILKNQIEKNSATIDSKNITLTLNERGMSSKANIDSVYFDILSTGDYKKGVLEATCWWGKASIVVPLYYTIQLRFGKTTVKLNVNKWLTMRTSHDGGDNKLFQSILALDEKNLCLEVTEGMRELGIEAIESPKTHQKIEANQIIFLDDKPGVVALQKKAGFKAILADTFENNTTASLNTYLDKWKNEVEFKPKDVIGNIKTKIIRDIQGEKLTASVSIGSYTYKNKSKEITVKIPSDIVSVLKFIDLIIRKSGEVNKEELDKLLKMSQKLCKKRRFGRNREYIVSFFENVCREIEGLISIHELKNSSTANQYSSQLKRKFEYLLLMFLKRGDEKIIDMVVECLTVNNLNGDAFKEFYRDLVSGNENSRLKKIIVKASLGNDLDAAKKLVNIFSQFHHKGIRVEDTKGFHPLSPKILADSFRPKISLCRKLYTVKDGVLNLNPSDTSIDIVENTTTTTSSKTSHGSNKPQGEITLKIEDWIGLIGFCKEHSVKRINLTGYKIPMIIAIKLMIPLSPVHEKPKVEGGFKVQSFEALVINKDLFPEDKKSNKNYINGLIDLINKSDDIKSIDFGELSISPEDAFTIYRNTKIEYIKFSIKKVSKYKYYKPDIKLTIDNVTDEDIPRLMQFLKSNHDVSTVKLKGWDVNVDLLLRLYRETKLDNIRLPHDHHIDLSDKKLTDDDIDEIAELIKKCDIKSINLSGNKISDRGVYKLCQKLRDKASTISIDLRNNNITEYNEFTLSRLFRKSPVHLDIRNTVKKLDLSIDVCELKRSDIFRLITYLEGNPQITSLNLNGQSSLKDEIARSLSEAEISLEELYLDGVGISDEGALKLSTMNTLKILCLNRTGEDSYSEVPEEEITDEGAKNIALLNNLEKLELSGQGIKNSGVIAISKLPKLRHLDLSENDLDSQSMNGFKENKSIKKLVLEDNPGIGLDGVKNLSKNKSIDELNLAGCIIKEDTNDKNKAVSKIAEMPLKKLDLSNNRRPSRIRRKGRLVYSRVNFQGIGLEGCQTLANMGTLESLNLSSSLQQKQEKTMDVSYFHKSKLESLDLKNNMITESSAIMLVQSNIEKLDFDRCNNIPTSIKKIAKSSLTPVDRQQCIRKLASENLENAKTKDYYISKQLMRSFSSKENKNKEESSSRPQEESSEIFGHCRVPSLGLLTFWKCTEDSIEVPDNLKKQYSSSLTTKS